MPMLIEIRIQFPKFHQKDKFLSCLPHYSVNSHDIDFKSGTLLGKWQDDPIAATLWFKIPSNLNQANRQKASWF